METRPSIDFRELAVRLASYGLRVFAEFGLGGRNGTIPGVGLSVEDFVWKVLSEYADGTLTFEAERGALYSLLARALRNDIIDALRRAAHAHEEARASQARPKNSDGEPASLDEMPTPQADINELLDETRCLERLRALFRDEPELAAIVDAVVELNLSKPRDIAKSLGIPVTEYQNRKKRLRRRLIEYHIVEVEEL